MRALSAFELQHGRDAPPPDRRTLTAGPLSLLLDGSDVRYVRFGGLEVVRRIFVGVRDPTWLTVPSSLRQLSVDEGEEDAFTVVFVTEHRGAGIDATCQGTIVGWSEGTLSYAVDVEANAEFRFNRIGICVLHPAELVAGRRYLAVAPAGRYAGRLPREIGVQTYVDGTFYPLFPSFSELAIQMDEIEARFAFEGDLFEMEDQRNWTDNSFKTYSTELALGFPYVAQASEAISQRVILSCNGTPAPSRPRSRRTRLEVGRPVGRTLPAIGLGTASHGSPPSDRERALLGELRLDHLRVDLDLARPDWSAQLEREVATCAKLECELELAVFVRASTLRELDRLAARLGQAGQARVDRVLVFTRDHETTPGPWVAQVRRRLGAAIAGVPLAGGTNLFFCEINRVRPDPEVMDGVAYSITPQIHAFDELSMVETLEAQAETVRSARVLCGDRVLFVGPVTLKMRWNAHARGQEEREPRAGELPFPVDPRQSSLFTAAWTVGSLRALAEAGADSLTYYETTGWRGLLEVEDPPEGDRFPSWPGMIFPVYYVFHALAGWRDADVLRVSSQDRLVADGLALRRGSRVRTLVANLTAEPRAVEISGLPSGPVTLCVLDHYSAAEAANSPARLEERVRHHRSAGRSLVIDLEPYAVVRLDAG